MAKKVIQPALGFMQHPKAGRNTQQMSFTIYRIQMTHTKFKFKCDQA